MDTISNRFVFIVVLSLVGKSISDDCRYRRYVTAVIPGFISHENVTIVFSDLSNAKDACDSMGDNCKGVVLPLHNRMRAYILASGDELYFTRGAMSWRKSCTNTCEYRLSVDYVRRNSFYRKICPTAQTLDGEWGEWSSWGQCSQSCGRLGHQLRNRQCQVSLTRLRCSGYRYQRRVCNYAKKCPETLADVFGVYGTEGFQVAGSTGVYTTCIRTEQEDKMSCGGESVTMEQCTRRFDCCYANDTTYAISGGPRCYQPKRFIGSSGLIGWSVWSPWTVCSRSCENGTRSRTRICTGSIPNLETCSGTDSQTESCTLGTCPCVVNPCHNGGICQPDNRVARGYRCECQRNFIGKHCDYGEPNLSCGNDSIEVSFDRRIVPDEGLIDDVRYIHFQGFESSGCFARLSDDRTQYVLSIPPPIDRSCGSIVNITGDEYTIRNKILWRLTDQSATSTVVLLDLTCAYDKQLNMTTGLGFGIQPTIRTLSVQEARSTFHVDMRLYRSDDYSERSLYREAPTVAEGEILYVSVDLGLISITNPENEVLVLERCYATDTTETRKSVYDFIIDGCSTNPSFTTIVENGESSRGRWGFRVFEWATRSETSDIFVVCKVFVCDAGYEECAPSCGGINSTSQPPDVDIEPDLTDVQSSLIQDLLNSLVIDPGSNFTNGLARRRRDTIKVNQAHIDVLPRKHKGNGILFNPFVVSKRIQTIRPLPDEISQEVLRKNFQKNSEIHAMTSSSATNDQTTCGVTSYILVGCGSVIIYVIIAFMIKKLILECKK